MEEGEIRKISADLKNKFGFSKEEASIETMLTDGELEVKVSERLLAEVKKTINLTPGLAGVARKKGLKLHKTIKAAEASILFFLNKTIKRLETIGEMRTVERCWKDLLQRACDLGLFKKAECKFKIITMKRDSAKISFHPNLVKILKEIFRPNATTDMDIKVGFGKNNLVILSLPEKNQPIPLIHCAHCVFVKNILRKIMEKNSAGRKAKAERVVKTKNGIEKSARDLFAPFGSAVKKITVYYKKGIYYVPIIINSFKIKTTISSLNGAIEKAQEIEVLLRNINGKVDNINIRQKGGKDGIYKLTLKINSFRVLVSASSIPKMEAELTQTAKKLGDLFALKDA